MIRNIIWDRHRLGCEIEGLAQQIERANVPVNTWIENAVNRLLKIASEIK